MNMDIPTTIRIYRKKLGWSQAELGAKMGMTGPGISSWETGRTSPDWHQLEKLAYVFGIPTEFLLHGGMINEQTEHYDLNSFKDFETLCKKRNTTPEQVFMYLEFPMEYLEKYKQGDSLSLGMMDAIMLYLSKTGTDSVRKPSTNHTHWIPVLGRVAAGIPAEMIEDVIDYEEIDDSVGEAFALVIAGDSMEPKLSRGDVVIVRRQEDVESGEIAVVTVNGDDATCKRVIKRDDGILLVSLNPAYDPQFYSCEDIRTLPVTVLGRVVEARCKL